MTLAVVGAATMAGCRSMVGTKPASVVPGGIPELRSVALTQYACVPQAMEPNTAMPDVGVDEATARDMAAYLYTLDE